MAAHKVGRLPFPSGEFHGIVDWHMRFPCSRWLGFLSRVFGYDGTIAFAGVGLAGISDFWFWLCIDAVCADALSVAQGWSILQVVWRAVRLLL